MKKKYFRYFGAFLIIYLVLILTLYMFVCMKDMSVINALTIKNLELQNQREAVEIKHTELLSQVIEQEELWLHEAVKP